VTTTHVYLQLSRILTTASQFSLYII